MLYIVEGADGSGKTTFINQFTADLNEEDYLCWRSNRKLKNQYKVWNNLKKLSKRKIVITDRSFISEIIYRAIKYDKLNTINLKEIAKLLDENITIIYCKNDNAYANAKKRGEIYVRSAEEHKKICIAYDVIMEMIKQFTTSKVIEYNYNKYGE